MLRSCILLRSATLTKCYLRDYSVLVLFIPSYWNGSIPWVSTTLIDFNIIKETTEFITNEGLENSSAKLFPEGTLLMAMYGQGKTRGKVAVLGIEATTNQACGAIIPNNTKINNFFLFHNISNRYDEIRDLSNQGGQENLSGEIIKNLSVNFPSLSEQTKIASFLTYVDDKLQTLKKKKALLEQYKKGVMQKIFSQETEERGSQIPSEKTKKNLQLRFKDNKGKDFPEWEEKRIEEIVERIQSGKDKPNESKDFKIYGSMGVIGYNSTFSYEGTYIVIARVGANAGTVNIVSGKFGVSDNALVLECVSSCNVNFIYYLLKFINLNKLVFGSGQPLITGGHLKAQIAQVPSLPEQTKIASFLSLIDEKINQCQFQIEKTERWKKELLQKMFV